MSSGDTARFHADCGLCGNRQQVSDTPASSSRHTSNAAQGTNSGQEGRNVPQWGLWICNQCRAENHDGIVPESNADFVASLTARGIPLQYNALGWLKIPK